MKKYCILFFMLVGTMLLQAQVRRTPVQRTQTQQAPTVVIKENEPQAVNGHLAFLGIPLVQNRARIEASLREKGIIKKEDEYGNIRYEGMVYGVKSSVAILGGYQQGENTEGISYYEMKNYSKTQARNRVFAYQKAFLNATGGKVVENDMSYNSDEGGQIEIETTNKGHITIQYGNEDEVNFESNFFVVTVQFREF